VTGMPAPTAYFGGKSRIAPWIAGLLPKHRTYAEPYFGSGAVLFAKRPSHTEIVNDLDGELVNFFRVLRERPGDLERACRLTPYARAEYEACQLDPSLDDLERARRWFVRVNMSISHTPRNTGFAIARAADGGGGSDHAHKFARYVARFAAAAARLQCVQVDNRPALDVIAKHDHPNTAFYVDPPYALEVRSLRSKRRGTDYRVDGAEPEQHRALAEALHACRGAVLLSGYDGGLYRELYADWWRVDRRVMVPTGNGSGRGAKWNTEVVWSNRPLAVQGALDLTEASP
jgi:DNA adenine methylase